MRNFPDVVCNDAPPVLLLALLRSSRNATLALGLRSTFGCACWFSLGFADWRGFGLRLRFRNGFCLRCRRFGRVLRPRLRLVIGLVESRPLENQSSASTQQATRRATANTALNARVRGHRMKYIRDIATFLALIRIGRHGSIPDLLRTLGDCTLVSNSDY